MRNLPEKILKETKERGSNARSAGTDDAHEYWATVPPAPASSPEEKEVAERMFHLRNRYRFIADSMPHLIWSTQPDGTLDYFNAYAIAYTGATPQDLHVRGWRHIFHPKDYRILIQAYHQLIKRGEEFRYEIRIRRKDGQYHWHQAHGVPLYDEEGNLVRWYGTCTDIDALKQTENALRNREVRLKASEERQRLIFEEAAVGMVLVDMDGILQKPNRAFYTLLGYAEEEMTSKSFRIFTVPEDIAPTEAAAERLINGECDVIHWEKRYRHKNGAIIHALVKISLLYDAEGNAEYYNTQVIDITERKRVEQQSIATNAWLAAANRKLEQQKMALETANVKLESLATTDGLTEVKNHRAFQERVRTDVERSVRYEEDLSLLLLDVDSFKQYNDMYGHPAGDRVLKTVAQQLLQISRNCDFVARYGGEEFVIIMPETDRSGAIEAAERIRLAIQDHEWPQRSVTVSVGVAGLLPGEDSAQTLIDRADKAMYEAKQRGRNCLVHADDIGERVLLREEVDSLNEALQQILTLQSDAFACVSEADKGLELDAYAAVSKWRRILDTHFEPKAVKAFLKLMRQAGKKNKKHD